MIPVGGKPGLCCCEHSLTHTQTVHIKDRPVANDKKVGEAYSNKQLTVSTPGTINMYREKLAELE